MRSREKQYGNVNNTDLFYQERLNSVINLNFLQCCSLAIFGKVSETHGRFRKIFN